MNPTTQTKDERINLRLKHNAKQMLERAASFEGQTISKFALSSALARAEKTIQKHEVMALIANDSDSLCWTRLTLANGHKKSYIWPYI